MQLNVAFELLTKAKTLLTTKELVLLQLRPLIKTCGGCTKKKTRNYFAYEAPDKPISDAMRRLEATFFNTVVDSH